MKNLLEDFHLLEIESNPSSDTDQGQKSIGTIVLLILAIFACIIFMIAGGIMAGKSDTKAVETTADHSSSDDQSFGLLDGIVETDRSITSDTIEDGLREMGFLITQEYYFTEVITDQKSLNLLSVFNIKTSSYVVSYDGTVSAGIEFNHTSVEIDDDNKVISITIPKAEIYAVEIDPDSFKLIDKKETPLSSYSVDEFNDALKELKKTAQQKAEDKGILDKAQENAETVIKNFVNSIVDTTEYTIKIKTSK